GNDRPLFQMGDHLPAERLEGPHRGGQDDQVGPFDRLRKRQRIPVDRAERDPLPEPPPLRAISDDLPRQPLFSCDQAEGAADQADPDDRHSFKEHRYISRSTAAAILLSCAISALKSFGSIACSPSQNASSGRECTSIIRPSAPAATAALA